MANQSRRVFTVYFGREHAHCVEAEVQGHPKPFRFWFDDLPHLKRLLLDAVKHEGLPDWTKQIIYDDTAFAMKLQTQGHEQ